MPGRHIRNACIEVTILTSLLVFLENDLLKLNVVSALINAKLTKRIVSIVLCHRFL